MPIEKTLPQEKFSPYDKVFFIVSYFCSSDCKIFST